MWPKVSMKANSYTLRRITYEQTLVTRWMFLTLKVVECRSGSPGKDCFRQLMSTNDFFRN